MEEHAKGSVAPRVNAPRTIAVVGGTHGNERGGVWTVRNLLGDPARFSFPGLRILGVIANHAAVERNLRYLDRDLNRCFGPALSDQPAGGTLDREQRRALELRQQVRLDGRPPDLLIDLHNTTSAMGVSWLITSLDPWPLYLGWQAMLRDPRVRILHTPETVRSNVFLPSMGKSEITLEIGPVPHGTESHWAWEAAETHVRAALQTLSELPEDFDPSAALLQARFEFYETVSVQPYPVGADGRSRCLIHREAVGGDYRRFQAGDPLFLDPRTGETIVHSGEPMHPIFLGEAAYVESGIAFHATRRLLWDGASGEPC
jgi:aspartoacylase